MFGRHVEVAEVAPSCTSIGAHRPLVQLALPGQGDDATREQATRRLVELVLAGLRNHAGPPLPGDPLGAAAIADVGNAHGDG